MDGTLTEIKAFVEGFEIFAPGASLGGVESLIKVPSLMIPDEISHGPATTEIPKNLVRMSVGIENVDDLCETSGQRSRSRLLNVSPRNGN